MSVTYAAGIAASGALCSFLLGEVSYAIAGSRGLPGSRGYVLRSAAAAAVSSARLLSFAFFYTMFSWNFTDSAIFDGSAGRAVAVAFVAYAASKIVTAKPAGAPPVSLEEAAENNPAFRIAKLMFLSLLAYAFLAGPSSFSWYFLSQAAFGYAVKKIVAAAARKRRG